jgi:hypothetical protein
LLHLVGVPYYFTYIDDARSNTNQVYYDECFGGDLFNEAFGSSYGRAPNYRRISEKLTAHNVEGIGRGLN